MGKASGAILRVYDDLYLLTNWHVVTGRRWFPPKDRLEDWLDKPQWIGKGFTEGSPDSLDVSIPLNGSLRLLARLKLEVPEEIHDHYEHNYAWVDAAAERLMDFGLVMPNEDLVCLHLSDQAQQWSNLISGVAGINIELGYTWHHAGLDHRPSLADPVFVVGYPRDIGADPEDPPVWTFGTIATDPMQEWRGTRFLIDARTREGQSGSAVIAYRPALGGLPPVHQLLGIYSGRIDSNADIGSAWQIDRIINDLHRQTWRPRRRVLDDSVDHILKALPPPPL
jgi:hypothetical protein